MSITGDDVTDELLPAASRLVLALRTHNAHEVAAAFNDAAATCARYGHDPASALAVVLAALVPLHETPADLLWWWKCRGEHERLVGAGVAPESAAHLIEQASPRHHRGR